MKVVDKPWGREIWFAVEDEYVGKIIEVKKGERLSLQFHEEKKETMYLLEGRMALTFGDEELELAEGESITIKPGVKHRINALSDVKVVEVSTPQVEDVIRLEDDYGRTG
ncbi:MAG: cupin domain-containing protein [Candidatus Altiarchaeales archaeon]|nr:cupin domain-containing protein [Candidatus Altiarchaeales archaeon]MBD3416801.1 cupin domain-containing protein [Candidatus Altiarchaeales archaeon]